MIQDIYPHKLDNQFKPGVEPSDEDTVFWIRGGKVLCGFDEGGVVFPKAGECRGAEALIYLFEMDGERFFLNLDDGVEVRGGYEFTPLKSLRQKNVPRKHLIFAAITALHLDDWYRSAVYCGRCGSHLDFSDTERAKVCPACGKIFYPRINPAVIVGVTDGDNLLLTKYAGRGMPFYALVAGFTEIGETFEETVRREVMEETGLQVTNIRYYKSQPWGFADDILAGYFCDVEGDPAIHVDRTELKEAVWVPRREIEGQPNDFSLTNEMMTVFRDGLV